MREERPFVPGWPRQYSHLSSSVSPKRALEPRAPSHCDPRHRHEGLAMLIVGHGKVMRCVRIRTCVTGRRRHVVSLAVGHNGRVVRGLARLGRTGRIQEGDPPGARFGQRRWAGINVIDCQTMGGSPYCRLGSAASSFGVAQRHGRIQSAKCLIRPVSF